MTDSTTGSSTPATDATVAAALGVGNVIPADVTTSATDADRADQQASEDPAEADLGDAGRRALDRLRADVRDERRRRIEAETALRNATETDAAARAAGEAERAAIAKANARILRAEIRAAAAGRFADPDDAVAFLDLDEFDVDEDGAVDGDAIRAALDHLLTRKPHLGAAQATRSPLPDRSQGGSDRDTALTTAQQFEAAMRGRL